MNKFLHDTQMVVPSYNQKFLDQENKRKENFVKTQLQPCEKLEFHLREQNTLADDHKPHSNICHVPKNFTEHNYSTKLSKSETYISGSPSDMSSRISPPGSVMPNKSLNVINPNKNFRRMDGYVSILKVCNERQSDFEEKSDYYGQRRGLPFRGARKTFIFPSAKEYPPGFLLTPYTTAPDRFLSHSFNMEVRETPLSLTSGSDWDQLSCSIWKKFLSHQQTEDVYKKKMTLWKLLYVYIKSSYPKYGLYLVGSTMNGFGGNKSDVDMCLLVRHAEIDQRNEALSYLSDILKLLYEHDFVNNLELIQAKVPILKFRDINHGLEVDLNCNNSVGIRNTHLMFCYSQMDWRVKPLVIIVKLWAHWHNINDAKNMTISSYSLTLMVIHFLQYGVSPAVLPCLHSMYPGKFSSSTDIGRILIHEEIDPYYSQNKMPLGELLYKFFQYYTLFDFAGKAISVRTGSVIAVENCRHVRTSKNDPHQWKYLCIEEPFDLTNTARSVYDSQIFGRICRIFRRSAELLKETHTLESIFKFRFY